MASNFKRTVDRTFRSESTVHDDHLSWCCARVATLDPAAAAVRCGGRTWTYLDLDERANRIAHLLRRNGVTRTHVVAVTVPRSFDLVASVLGILRAGAVYLPLDQALPESRKSFVLDEADVRVVLAPPDFSIAGRTNLVCDDDVLDGLPSMPVAGNSEPDDPAYLIYTSGSTGQPKGVLNSRRGLSYSAASLPSAFDIKPSDTVLQFLPMGFDAHLFEIALALSSGAALAVPELPAMPDRKLTEFMAEQGVSVVAMTPSSMQALPVDVDLPALRVVITGGEACAQDIVQRWGTRRSFYNVYGPTEVALWTSAALVTDRDMPPPIGLPAPGLVIDLLGEDGKRVLGGAPGEIVVRGPAVALGYLDRPLESARGFVSDSDGAGRAYRTGDVARRRSDGVLEFLGRVDRQVKVRGFRIETGEIERALATHRDVAASAVVKCGDGARASLVAHVVTVGKSAGGTPGGAVLRESMQYELWSKLHDSTHRSLDRDEANDWAGAWTDSTRRRPYAPEDLDDWVDETVRSVLEGRPERILDVGCGSGPVAMRLASEVSEYWGTDVSAAALTALGREFRRTSSGNVRLLQQAAIEMGEIPSDYFDVVVVNSVVQYLPSADALAEVVRCAVRATRDGGRIFVGDVRNLMLLEEFHLAAELSRSGGRVGSAAMWERARRAVLRERELVVHPNAFRRLGADIERVSSVRLRPKPGTRSNEMVTYRFDAIMTVGPSAQPSSPVQVVEWGAGCSDSVSLGASLDGRWPLLVRGIPSSRVSMLCEQARSLRAGRSPVVEQQCVHLAPDELLSIGRAMGADTELMLSTTRSDRLDLLVARSGEGERCLELVNELDPAASELDVLVNDPLRPERDAAVVRELRLHLESRLPDHMVPAVMMVVDELPRTVHGKVDHALLAEIDPLVGDSSHAPRMPRAAEQPFDVVQVRVAGAWADVLGIRPRDGADDFFAIGGTSLTAVQMAGVLERDRARPVPVDRLIAARTLAGMADVLRRLGEKPGLADLVDLAPSLSGLDVVFVHALAGTVAPYRTLAESMPAQSSRGIVCTAYPANSLEDVGRRYAELIRGRDLAGKPWVVAGWSLGGSLALEVARSASAAGLRTPLVVMIDAPAPLCDGDSRRSEEVRLQRVLGTGVVDSTLCRNGMELFRSYRPKRFGGEVVLFEAKGRPDLERRDPLFDRLEAALGWADVCPDLISVPVEGDHLSVLEQPSLAAAMRERLGTWVDRME